MSVVWCNGEIVDQLHLKSNERGLMLGDGIFETIAVRAGNPIWLPEHIQRMGDAAAELGIGFSSENIFDAVKAVLKHSQAEAEVLRITLTRGPTLRGLAAEGTTPSLIITLSPFDRSALQKSVRLATSAIRRNETAPSCRLKTLSYIDAIAAAREVSARADDALMLNSKGHVASTTIGNIFLLKANVLSTPSTDQAILPGIARQKLIRGAAELGLIVEERAVEIKELHAADCVFVTNSLRLATPVSSLDGKACGTRDIGFIQGYYEQHSKGDAT